MKRKRKPAASTVRRRRLCDARRAKLRKLLGNRCAWCGVSQNLTVDHINGRSWDIKEVYYSTRLRIYVEEAEAGLLQFLCLECNSTKGNATDEF